MEETVLTEIQKPKRKKKMIFIGILALVLIAAGIFGWIKYQEKKKQDYAKLQAETIVDMRVSFLMATLIVGSYSDVWDNAIDNGNDFNVAISEFKSSIEDNALKDRKDEQESIKENMKLLQNPPENYTESYNVLKEMYGTYARIMEQAESPSGSLIEFNKNVNELYSDFEEKVEQLDITLPSDVKKIKEDMEKEKTTEN
ncbi:hypothetical protein [Bacillus sp. Au-Bac7]|uniref:hypothetical protein n=1 Tax=Bacillus sp. Au-Bac7 TaxID=2906458 RepID=UPI001E2C550B|nr:hypothetical protein [Bacillus sp. Au-Bac7]MCE4051866.1 hypothetical protein [Bacillus sp. Au-Bac7]